MSLTRIENKSYDLVESLSSQIQEQLYIASAYKDLFARRHAAVTEMAIETLDSRIKAATVRLEAERGTLPERDYERLNASLQQVSLLTLLLYTFDSLAH
jgi:hypothetical protein